MKCPASIIEDTNTIHEMLGNNIKFIQSRFGIIKINLDKTILFPTGLPGIIDKKFCLAHLPNKKFEPFKVLQSIENEKLAFIVYPLDNLELIDHNDIIACSKLLSIEIENMVICLITSIYYNSNSTTPKITVNLRAPIIIDLHKYLAVQHIFSHEKYNIQHELLFTPN
ncbi:flagellar assembly protein FliW [Rickettsiales bacterium Ac37b]|nr:flagellar assembly protein FliW [Rickettsiales bacterium Ac37b]